ncbi:hypothetical protein HDV05_004364 [Chytridiales sp. JEL 0842]|nr:hypothetical protein HDV05_004364 [Chytridiales sp. JEL 0842]
MYNVRDVDVNEICTDMMNADDDDEWEDEEVNYIVMDMGSELTAEKVKGAARNYQGISLIGLETPNPYLRLGKSVYKGSFDTTVGTDMIFAASATRTKKKTKAPSAPKYGLENAIYTDETRQDQVATTMAFMGKSFVKLKFTPVQLEPRVSQQKSDEAGAIQKDGATIGPSNL